MTKQEFTDWIREKLSAILQFEVQNDMAEYIISMKSERDLDEYCRSLLDIQCVVHKQFLFDLKKRHKLFNQKPITSGVDDAATRFNKKVSKAQEKAEENTDTADKKQKKKWIKIEK